MLRHAKIVTLGAFIALAGSTSVLADEKPWWPLNVFDFDQKPAKLVAYTPRLKKATKPWNICILVPHMKDSFWVAVDYGLVTEAQRQGVKLTILAAGGYDQLPKQLSQFDDCMASKPDAIITAPISESAFGDKVKQGLAAGIPQIAAFNPVFKVPFTAKVAVDVWTDSNMVGKYIVEHANSKAENVLAFPGPQQSGWAEDSLEGFKAAIKDSSIKLLDAKFGDNGVDIQRKLIEDGLQSFPDTNIIFGTAPAVEAAVGAVAAAGMKGNVDIYAAHDNIAAFDLLKKGEIQGVCVLFGVAQAQIAIDLAVRAIEKDLPLTNVNTAPVVVTQANMASVNLNEAFGPANWQPVFAVDVK
jgi:protein TorT